MKAIIIDDEVNSVKTLAILLQKNCPEVEVVAQCTTAQDGIDAIRRIDPADLNLVLLDIEMPFMNGFELLEQIERINFEVIFTTAYDHYAINAFKFNAVGYLLKPVSARDLSDAVQRVLKMDKKISLGQLKQLLESMHSRPSIKQGFKIALPSLESIQYFSPAEIIRCEAHSNYSLFIIKDHSPILVSKNLGEYEPMLAPYNFFRVHKSHLVNLDFVKRYIRGEGGQLVMEDGATVDVSRTKKDEMLQKLAGH